MLSKNDKLIRQIVEYGSALYAVREDEHLKPSLEEGYRVGRRRVAIQMCRNKKFIEEIANQVENDPECAIGADVANILKDAQTHTQYLAQRALSLYALTLDKNP